MFFFLLIKMDTTWVTAFYEFGGEMQMSSIHLDKIPLFKSGVPLELRLRKSSDSSAPAGSGEGGGGSGATQAAAWRAMTEAEARMPMDDERRADALANLRTRRAEQEARRQKLAERGTGADKSPSSLGKRKIPAAAAMSDDEDGEFVILLPYIQSTKEFYDLAYIYMYGIEPTTIKEDIIKFYGETSLPEDFQLGYINVQLEGEKSPFHMSRHYLVQSLEYFSRKISFEKSLGTVEFMKQVRLPTFKLLIFDDQRELDEVDSLEYYHAVSFYKVLPPILTI